MDRFERAVEAVVDGDLDVLRQLLKEDPSLVRARSARITKGDPPVHGATLLHYIAANGVEDERQRSPQNAVEVARLLLEAGADPDALCDCYGSKCTTMALLVSSTPPAQASVQVPLLHGLIDEGASIAPTGEGHWTSPIETALVFGFHDAARAAQCGHPAIVELLIDAGEDPNRYNPPGTHAHSPPLHQAIAAGKLDVVRTLIARGARLDLRDTIHQGTPLGWAEYCDKPEIVEYLRQFTAE